jgi:hypothetical protein
MDSKSALLDFYKKSGFGQWEVSSRRGAKVRTELLISGVVINFNLKKI